MESSRSRITAEQRRLMVEFVKKNRCVVTGRFTGPEGARQRSRVLTKMANTLNNAGSGAVKTPDKWLRSFQDWKSDTKRKAAKLASHARRSGGGPPLFGLSDVERELLDLIGEPCIGGNEEGGDPLEGPSSWELSYSEDPKSLESPELSAVPEPSEASDPSAAQNPIEPQKRNHSEDYDERMVSAMEQQAEAYSEIARQIGRIADLGITFYNAWVQHNNI